MPPVTRGKRARRCLFGRASQTNDDSFELGVLKQLEEEQMKKLKEYKVHAVDKSEVPAFYHTKKYTAEERRKRIGPPGGPTSVAVEQVGVDDDDDDLFNMSSDGSDIGIDENITSDSQPVDMFASHKVRPPARRAVSVPASDGSECGYALRNAAMKQQLVTSYLHVVRRNKSITGGKDIEESQGEPPAKKFARAGTGDGPSGSKGNNGTGAVRRTRKRGHALKRIRSTR